MTLNKNARQIEKVRAFSSSAPKDEIDLSYIPMGLLGKGAFGVVSQAKLCHNGQIVAIKMIIVNKYYKNRELSFMKALDHCNIVKLLYFFNRQGKTIDEQLQCFVLEYIPISVYHYLQKMKKEMRVIPPILIKLMMYQLFRGLAYIHNQNICHRDVKPENILLNPNTGILKLGDLGSAKKLVKGQVNVSYIGSRYCRPPELMFGSVYYTTYVDVWSAGCVFAHILLRRELFASTCNLDQLVEVIKVLGTPTQEQVEDLNPAYVSYNFPLIEPIPLRSMFSPVIPDTAIDLLSQLLVYRPMGRLHPMVACAHPYFDKLGEDGTLLPNGLSLPPLFNFTDSERELQEKLNINLLRKC